MTYTQNIFRKSLIMLPVIVAIGFMLTGPLGSDIIAEPQNVPDNALLPDVTPGVPKHLNIHNQQQNESLRFTNVWANIGPGTLEYEPLFPDPNANEGETQDAFQNLYDDEGNFGLTDQNIWHQTVSEFIFHETHNHWHINDIGEFSVRVDNNGVPGDIAVGDNGETASIKVGFCITNVFKYNGDESPTSQRIYWDCEVGLQGIQPGWADQYHQSVEGNEIDITGLPNDTYFLVHKWNPANAFVDGDDTNDESWVKFILSQENNGNGNRKITITEEFAPECQADGSTPGICGDLRKNS
jgi:hypothetical protein